MTSPYTYSNVNAMNGSVARAKQLADHFESIFRQTHGKTSGANLYARQAYKQRYNQALGNYNTYYNNWMKAGRPGALDALQAKYTNVDQVLGKILPYDEQSALDRINTTRTYNQNLIDLGNQQNQVNQDYATQKHVYDQNVPILARQLLNNYAGRGMANSTGYGESVGQQNTQLANQLSGLDASKQVALANIASSKGQLNAGYQNDLSSILYNAVQNLTSKAGTLGLTKNKGIDIYNDPSLLIQLAQKMLTSSGG